MSPVITFAAFYCFQMTNKCSICVILIGGEAAYQPPFFEPDVEGPQAPELFFEDGPHAPEGGSEGEGEVGVRAKVRWE